MAIYTLVKAKKRYEQVTPEMAWQMMRILKAFYRKGVADACVSGDTNACRGLAEATTEPNRWGLVQTREAGGGDVRVTDSHNWWENRISDVAEELGCGAYAMLRGDRNSPGLWAKAGAYASNYLSVFAVMCQCMYNKGLTDYCRNPDASRIPAFLDKCRRDFGWWTAKGYRKVKDDRLVGYMQDCCLDRSESDEGKKWGLDRQKYETFAAAVGLAVLYRKNRQK